GRGQFRGEAGGRVDIGEVCPDGGDDLAADEPQPGDQGDAAGEHRGEGNGRLAVDAVGAQHVDDGGEGADGVGDVVGTVAECEGRSGEHLKPVEEDVGGPQLGLLAQDVVEDEDGQQHGDADNRQHEDSADGAHAHVEVLQALDQQHRGDDDRAGGGDE